LSAARVVPGGPVVRRAPQAVAVEPREGHPDRLRVVGARGDGDHWPSGEAGVRQWGPGDGGGGGCRRAVDVVTVVDVPRVVPEPGPRGAAGARSAGQRLHGAVEVDRENAGRPIAEAGEVVLVGGPEI